MRILYSQTILFLHRVKTAGGLGKTHSLCAVNGGFDAPGKPGPGTRDRQVTGGLVSQPL